MGAPFGKEVGGDGSLQESEGQTAVLFENPHQRRGPGETENHAGPLSGANPQISAATDGTGPNKSKNRHLPISDRLYEIFTALSSHLNHSTRGVRLSWGIGKS